MEGLIIAGYAAICIALFTVLRIPLNRWTVPTASIGGIVLTFALIQLLNFYHPYSGMSRQFLTSPPIAIDASRQAADSKFAMASTTRPSRRVTRAISAIARSQEVLPACCWCLRIRGEDLDWIDVEEAIRRGDLLGEGPPPKLDHVACETCEERVVFALRRIANR